MNYEAMPPRESNDSLAPTLLVTYYHQYLQSENSANFVHAVASRYTTGSLQRLAHEGDRLRRRAAILALGFLGDYDSNPVLGQALRDDDRGVRVLAESGIRQVWRRAGTPPQQMFLDRIIRYNDAQQFPEAIDAATELIAQSPEFAEAWNQRGIACYQLELFDDAVEDCQQALKLNPYHFDAAVGVAFSYLELGAAFASLEAFQHALDLYPDMEEVRLQIRFLQRALKEG